MSASAKLARLRRQSPPIAESVSEPIPTWGQGIAWIVPQALSDHPLWRDLLGLEPAEKEDALREFIRQHKVTRPLVITGAGCASPPDTILEGHRTRYHAMDVGVRVVPVIRRIDLTAAAEEEIIVKAALTSAHVRQMKPSKVFALEERLFVLYAARGQGFRSDLTSVGNNGSGASVGDTLTLVAAEANAPRNAVANRRKVFGSPIASKSLKDAVDRGTLSLTAGATIVRDAESPANVREALKEPAVGSAVLDEARAAVDARVRNEQGRPVPRGKGLSRKKPRVHAYQLPLDGSPVSERNGRLVVTRRVIGTTATEITIEESIAGSPADAAEEATQDRVDPPA